jgi:hypothetical protein
MLFNITKRAKFAFWWQVVFFGIPVKHHVCQGKKEDKQKHKFFLW